MMHKQRNPETRKHSSASTSTRQCCRTRSISVTR